MLAHLPVIASRHGAIAELVPDGHGGRLIDALDVGQIATAIIELARDPNLRHQLAVGRYWDPSDFSLDEVGQQEAALYLEAIGDYKGAAEVHGPRRGETKGSARVD
jgi:glycosyltransferase involved in cell wall biosynthesis